MEKGANTLYVNLISGPGAGKSNTSARLFSDLKLLGYNAEYVTEYAKDKTWMEDWLTLKIQPYVTAKQMYRCLRLKGKVEVVVTDSPFLLGLFYRGEGCDEHWDRHILHQYLKENHLTIFIERDTDAYKYNTKGRTQTLEESRNIDVKVKALLDDNGVHYNTVTFQKPVIHQDQEGRITNIEHPTATDILNRVILTLKLQSVVQETIDLVSGRAT